MGKHPTYIPGYKGTIEELAGGVENLPYDLQGAFFEHYLAKTQERADGDFKNKKPILANKLYMLTSKIHDIKGRLDTIWKICKPYTTKIYRD